MFSLGKFQFDTPVILAPMAGSSDLPFRELCYQMGASFTVGEMLTSDQQLWQSRKSCQRLQLSKHSGPKVMQIAGSDPKQLAAAAKACADQGADIIDINMGCPAKKVCKKAAGSALLSDERLVAEILKTVVRANPVPTTLKIRTGADINHRNGVEIARIAEAEGVQLLTVHGRTRSDKFMGNAEYQTIARIKQAVKIPIIANGDIDTPQKAQLVLDQTSADGIMCGRAAQGNPWLFLQIRYYLQNKRLPSPPDCTSVQKIILQHHYAIINFYGEHTGVRIARKHIGWYFDRWGKSQTDKKIFYSFTSSEQQRQWLKQGNYFKTTSNPCLAA